MTPAHSGALAPARNVHAAALLVARREERAQAEQVIRRADEPGERALTETEALEQLTPLGGVESRRLGFELHGHAEHLSEAIELGGNGSDDLIGALEIVLAEVDDGEHWLGGQQEVRAQQREFVVGKSRPVQGPSSLQFGDGPLECADLGAQRLVAPRRLAPPVELRFGARHVSQHQLELQRRKIVQRVVSAGYVDGAECA